jgi:hypothetical protein
VRLRRGAAPPGREPGYFDQVKTGGPRPGSLLAGPPL